MDEISHSVWIMKSHLNAHRTFTFCRWMRVIVVCVCFFLSFSKWLNIQSRINLNSNKWTIRVASWAWASIILYILRTILDSFEMWCVFYRSVFHVIQIAWIAEMLLLFAITSKINVIVRQFQCCKTMRCVCSMNESEQHLAVWHVICIVIRSFEMGKAVSVNKLTKSKIKPEENHSNRSFVIQELLLIVWHVC